MERHNPVQALSLIVMSFIFLAASYDAKSEPLTMIAWMTLFLYFCLSGIKKLA